MEVDTLGHLLETCNDIAGLVKTPDCCRMGLQ